ncbi:FAD/NAD-P-binding domain-containing protein [Mycena polygramma]|nr:FAD/NAD-P-binding domain-containing protein [Mycena polygramma]
MTLDPHQVASSWLRDYGAFLASGNVGGVVSCFQPDGFLRDFLTFTWNNRTLRGHDKIAVYLENTLTVASIADLKLESRRGLAPEMAGFNGQLVSPLTSTVSAGFTFGCKIGKGQGYATLALASDGGWKAISVLMQLADIRGHEEWLSEEGVYGGHTLSWTDVNRERHEAIEKNPHVLIVGGGHTGLNVAAQFKHMNIPSLLIEKNLRIGDNWRKRYPTLTLHGPKANSELLYQTFPKTWPVYAPRDKIADWLEQYAQSQDLVTWTNSRLLPGPTYDNSSGRWTVEIDRAGERVTLHPAHVVLAAGALGAPKIPVMENQSAFDGPVMHSVDYKGGKLFAGKRVVVVGAGNSSADLCQDLSFHGAESVTMVQRSASCVVSSSSVREMVERLYPEDLGTVVADLLLTAKPLPLMQKMFEETAEQALELQKDTHKGLREAGFHLNTNRNLFSLFNEGYGGYWFDVGCADLIRSGKVKIKHGVEIKRLEKNSVIFTDGSSLEADAIILATSCESIRDTMRGVFGDAIIDQTDPVWGVDDEGELRGVYRPSGYPNLWFTGGEFYTSRVRPKQLALEIKAIELGLLKL